MVNQTSMQRFPWVAVEEKETRSFYGRVCRPWGPIEDCALSSAGGLYEGDLNDEDEVRDLLDAASRGAERLIAGTEPDGDQAPDFAFRIPDGSTAKSWERITSLGDRKLQAGLWWDRTEEPFSLREGDIALRLPYEKETARGHVDEDTDSQKYSLRIIPQSESVESMVAGRLKQGESFDRCWIGFVTAVDTDHEPSFEIVSEASEEPFLVESVACGIAASYFHYAFSNATFGAVPNTLLAMPAGGAHHMHINVSDEEILAVVRKIRSQT